ncbi:MAG: HAMP domain-containing protein [Rhodocyclaceae bacterium]|nr:HAMP domain-containing protein [Rhodocyclaceae bacterium]
MVRTFLLIGLLMLLSLLAWFAIFTSLEREPRSHQMAQTLTSIANLTRAALISARPEARRYLLQELSDREGIHVYPADESDIVLPREMPEFLEKTAELVRAELGKDTRFALELNGESALFVSFRIHHDEYWVALPRERMERKISQQWLGWMIASGLLALIGAWLIMFRVTRPLKALSHAAKEIARGRNPPPLPEQGPDEIASVAQTFNQMNTALARMDSDRALILAGISHDLRTPLTRLRMGIEMSGSDDASRDAMVADVEEIDRTIGQFLDFARADDGEAFALTDISAMLGEIVSHYARLGYELGSDIQDGLSANVRPKAVRRAVCNLIDNAIRYAPSASLDLSLKRQGQKLEIDVADRGPGIPEQELERLKLPFTRLNEARSNTTGAGLGLAIVERILRGHAGTFELIAREGGGLIARLTIPA